MASQSNPGSPTGESDAAASLAGPSPRRGKPTGWRKWLFRLIALTVMPTLLFLLVELALRMFGYGYPTSFFIKGVGPAHGETIYTENVAFGRRFFPPALARTGVPIVMPAVKAPGTFRVFVFGESAAMGYPDPAGSFARILEVMLRDRYPAKRFEVINTAVVAINSHVALPIARECTEHDPDLFVVHLGNNEVIGPFGVAGVLGAYSPHLRLVRANLAVKTTRTGQLADSLIQRLRPGSSPSAWGGMGLFARSQLRSDDPRLAGMLDAYRQNLEDICQVGIAAGVPVLVCTIPVNLRDCTPFASLHAADLTATQTTAWDQAYAAGVKEEEAGHLAEALERYAEAHNIDASFADLAFRQARCLAALGQKEAARQKYENARDLDALRFRSDTRINATIRAVTDALGPAGVHRVDAERDFAAASPNGIPGEDMFLEHVHMNFTGNYVLARSVFQAITTLPPPAGPSGGRVAADDRLLAEAQCAERLAYGVWNRYMAESEIRTMFYDPPFDKQFDHVARDKRWDARLAERGAEFSPERMRAAVEAYQKALAATPGDWMMRQGLADLLAAGGEPERAVAQYRFVLQEVPHHYAASQNLGKLLLNLGDAAGAKLCFEAAIKSNPGFMPARYDIAGVLLAQGKAEEAVAHFAASVDHDPNRAEGLAYFALFLLDLDRRAEARARLQEAFAINPDSAGAHLIMARLLAKEGAADDALAHCEAALRSRPSLLPKVTELRDELHKQKAQKKIQAP